MARQIVTGAPSKGNEQCSHNRALHKLYTRQVASPKRYFRDHEDRDEVKRRAEEDFLNLYLEHGGTQRFKTLKCLFHDDGSPSASIYRGRFHCFGCGISLDVFEFIQRVRGEDFKGALAFLAARYGVQLTSGSLTDAERRDYARRRAVAEQEAREIVAWKESMLAALCDARDAYFHAYHRALRYILRHGLDAPMGNLAAEVVDLYEPHYQDMDGRIKVVSRAKFNEMLPFFRSQRAA